jgi:Xaa-Pro aminopeptidase
MIVEQIQRALRKSNIDGWLFFDHHGRDPVGYRILQLPDTVEATRRWYYFIPAVAEPKKLVHRIEPEVLDSLPGKKESYSSWPDQQAKLIQLLSGCSRIAMQYSPKCAIPYVSLVDAGTLELVREAGVEVLSSADLVQEFEARWTEQQYKQHVAAGKLVDQVRRDAFDFVGAKIRAGEISEYEVQQFILTEFSRAGLITSHGPIVAVDANASNPHYEPSRDRTSMIRSGNLLLIDLWAKLAEQTAVYYDVTWAGFCGENIPTPIQNVFEIVRNARKRASDFVIRKIGAGERLAGYEVDDEARAYIQLHGFGESFFHRTGHSIGTEVHGTGANMDNLESHDERAIIANTCFSIEPGIYLQEFGIRSEVNVYVAEGGAEVTGEQQMELIRI